MLGRYHGALAGASGVHVRASKDCGQHHEKALQAFGLHFPTHIEASVGYKVAEDSENVDPPVDARPAKDSPSQPRDSHVGPAFHIPMIQEKSLQDLPS